MKRLIPILLMAVVLLAACSTFYVKTPDVNIPCPVCGYADYAYRWVQPHWPLFVNGVLTAYGEPTLIVKCRKCGYAYPVDEHGNPQHYYGTTGVFDKRNP